MAEEEREGARMLTGPEYETQLLARLWRNPERIPQVMGDLRPTHFTGPFQSDTVHGMCGSFGSP